MLKKLLKYELKSIFKFLIIFYTLALFFAAVSRAVLSVEDSLIMKIVGEIFRGAAISMMFSIAINNVMRMWVRFRQSFYGDESYLTHTLPIKKNILILSKIITSIVTLFCSTAVIGITLVIAYYSKDNVEYIKALMTMLENVHDVKILPIAFGIMVMLFLEFLNTILCGFVGIILGHRMNNSRISFSVLFGFIIYMLSQLVVLLSVFVLGIGNAEIMNLFFTNSPVSTDVFYTLVIACAVAYFIVCIATVFINIKLFSKGVNVE